MALYYAQQFATTKLSVSGGIDTSQTTGIVLQSVSGIDITKPGILCLSWSDPLNTDTYEYVSYTSIDGSNELQGVTRGAEGSTGRAHDNLSDVAWVLSESHINNLNDMFETGGDGFKQIATPSNPSSGRNKLYFKSDNILYSLTSAGTEAAVSGTKAAGSDVTTGTDDAKYVTSKALADANVKSTGRLVWSAQTALSPTFTHSASTGEEEVTGLRTSLPVLTGTYTIIATFIGYMSVGTSNNVLRIRAGTSTTYLSNAEKAQIYIGNAKTQETATCKAIFTANLSTQTYIVIGAAADGAASSFSLSSSGNRTSVCIEVYSP